MKILKCVPAAIVGFLATSFAFDHASTTSSSGSSGSSFSSSGCSSIDDLCEMSDYSSFCIFLKEHGLYDSVSTGTWTIFLPTNEAFEHISDELARLDDRRLSEILKFHLVEGDDGMLAINSMYERGADIFMAETKPGFSYPPESICGGGLYYVLSEVMLQPIAIPDVSQSGQSATLGFKALSLTSADDLPKSCYLSPTCNNIPKKGYVDPVTGFTNSTGFDALETDKCCNICPNGGMTKYDPYDYLLLDLMWNPTFCNAFEDGHDFTLTHMPAMRCSSSLSEGLSIHGLWPSWYDGFGACCNATGSNRPLDPNEVMHSWDDDLWVRMLQDWYDPTFHDSRSDEDVGCQICYAQNHEWQKHGLCYTDSPEEYFRAGLDMYTMLEEQRKQINSMNGTTISVEDIEALFPKKVNVVCDPQASTNTNTYQTFSELQICFTDERTMIDCPTATYESSWTTACKHTILIPNFV
mmetsp:Transcript_2471/g.5402  ORF Transcript_2471/g.5402 Transcript_2471/m.5402 type:complete len:467 (-) Transcript_2471:2809-4209(-)